MYMTVSSVPLCNIGLKILSRTSLDEKKIIDLTPLTIPVARICIHLMWHQYWRREKITSDDNYYDSLLDTKYSSAKNNGNCFLATQNTPANDSGLTPVPDVTLESKVHNNIWYEDKKAVTIPINKFLSEREIEICTPVRNVITHVSDKKYKYSRLDCFLRVLPIDGNYLFSVTSKSG